MIEPNWGTQTTSGTVTFAAVPGYVVDGGTDGSNTPGQHIDIQNSELIGLPINVAGSSVRNSIFSRRDFVSSNARLSLNTLLPRNFTGNQVFLPCQGCLGASGTAQTYQLSTSVSPYVGAIQWNLGTAPIVWSCSSARGGGTACNDVTIGGRSDPASGTSTSRSILETTGTLGRPTKNGIDKNGADMDIQGGLPTGAGMPGNINFLTGNAHESSSNVVDGTRRWRITALGHIFAFADNTYDIGAAVANRPRSGYFATSIVTPIVALSANITWTSGAGVPSADSCVASNGGSLYSRTDGDATHTLYVCDNYYSHLDTKIVILSLWIIPQP